MITNFLATLKKQTPQKEPNSQQTEGPQQLNQSGVVVNGLDYLECPHKDMHTGELLNLICLGGEDKPQNHDLLICCLCQEQGHQNHKVKSLKAFLRDCTQYIQSNKQDEKSFKTLEKEEILIALKMQETQILQQIVKIRDDVFSELVSLEGVVSELFQKLVSQVEARQVSETDLSGLLNQVYESQNELDKLTASLKQLIDVVPEEQKQQNKQQFETKDILNQLQVMNADHSSLLEQTSTAIKKSISDLKTTFRDKVKIDLFHPELRFYFSAEFKHPNVTIISPTLAKANTGSSGYKFAVMTPSLDLSLGKNVKFGFKMKEVSSSNWLAVGMCHLQTIQSKNYAFSFSQLGHGAYMISSNGGSWSTTASQFNNIVKTFKFAKNDIIYCLYNPSAKTISFKKAKSNDTYKLTFEPTNQPLHPCALFYYLNDEVEFLQPHEVEGQI